MSSPRSYRGIPSRQDSAADRFRYAWLVARRIDYSKVRPFSISLTPHWSWNENAENPRIYVAGNPRGNMEKLGRSPSRGL